MAAKTTATADQKLSVGASVHYVSAHGVCRPAIVIDTDDDETVVLFAFLLPDEGGAASHATCMHDEKKRAVGTWHWPEEA